MFRDAHTISLAAFGANKHCEHSRDDEATKGQTEKRQAAPTQHKTRPEEKRGLRLDGWMVGQEETAIGEPNKGGKCGNSLATTGRSEAMPVCDSLDQPRGWKGEDQSTEEPGAQLR